MGNEAAPDEPCEVHTDTGYGTRENDRGQIKRLAHIKNADGNQSEQHIYEDTEMIKRMLETNLPHGDRSQRRVRGARRQTC